MANASNPIVVITFFADGTTATGDQYIVVQSPPTNEYGRLNAELRFLRAKLQLAVDKFEQVKRNAMEQLSFHQRFPGNCPPPSTQSEIILEEAKLRTKEIRLAIAEKQAEILQTDEGRRRKFSNDTAQQKEATANREYQRRMTAIGNIQA